MAPRLRADDTVLVISGRDRGKRGKIIRVDPRGNKVVIEGVNIITRHVKNRPGVRQSGLVKQEAPIDQSNVVVLDPDTSLPGRVRWRFLEDGTKVRMVGRAGGD